MTYHSYDQPASTLGDYSKINDHYNVEISLVRMDSDWNLKKDADESLYFERELHKWEGEDQVIIAERCITYKKDGTIILNIPKRGAGGYRYGHHKGIDSLLSYLPNNVGMYETASNDKTYLLYDTDKNVRANSYSPKLIWDITKCLSIVLSPDGKVKGPKKIERGPKKFASNEPLEKQLEEKHFREMTKARLKSDLEIDYNKQYATFRGLSTGLHHHVIEMYRPSIFMDKGPNSGLIRRVFVGRFMDEIRDSTKCKNLALDIIKDIPDSCLTDKFKALRNA